MLISQSQSSAISLAIGDQGEVVAPDLASGVTVAANRNGPFGFVSATKELIELAEGSAMPTVIAA